MVALHLLVVLRRVSTSASPAVQFRCDGVNDGLDLAEFLFQVLGAGARAVLVNPVGGVLDSLEDSLLVLIRELATKALLVTELGLEAVDERLRGEESAAGFYAEEGEGGGCAVGGHDRGGDHI